MERHDEGGGDWRLQSDAPLPAALAAGAATVAGGTAVVDGGDSAGLLPPPPPPPPPPPQLIVDRAPGVPQAVELATTTTAVSLLWEPVSCTVHSLVPVAIEYNINYELQMQQVDDKGLQHERWSVQYLGTACFVQIKGLRPGRTYAARVTAVPHVTSLMDVVVVPSPPSSHHLVDTSPSEPMGQPAPTLAIRSKKDLKFKWDEPEETGGRALEYVVQMSPAPEGWSAPPTFEGFFEVYRGAERSYQAKRLVPGVQYCCRVKAVNMMGQSAWSPLAVFYTQATVPSWAPHDAPFVYDTTANSVTLGWPEAGNNGGTVSGYEVEMDEGTGFRHVARATERHCMVQGLRSGILYKFRVRTENEAGRSLWSPVGEGRTAAVPPASCSTPSVMGTSQTSLAVRWEGPHDDGGSPVLYYQAEVRPKCAAARRGLSDDWVIAYQGPDPACTIGGLRAGCSYMVRVAAVSQAGAGAFSSAANLHTAPHTPDCPGAPAVVAQQQTELAVAWSAPEHDGGSRITAFRLEMCCLGGTDGPRGDGGKGKSKLDPPFELAYLGPGRSAVASNLEPGHRYAFRCSAMNGQGSSGWGPAAQADTLPGLPFPVDSLHLVAATSTSMKVRWRQPHGQGAAVSSYVVEMAPAAALPDSQQQQQQVQAANGGDSQQQSDSCDVAARDEAQQQQQRPAANGVAAGGGGPADLDALFQPAYQGPECSCTVSGLEPHTAYTFRVRAINAVGCSISERETFRTAAAPPSTPRHAQQEACTPSSLHVGWQAPAADHGAAISGYQLECARGSRPASAAWRLAHQGATTQAQVEGLEAGCRYLVRVRAGNTCGWGPWCEALPCATAPDHPAAPPGLTAKAVGTSVRVGWEAAEDNGAAIQAYQLEMAAAAAAGGPHFVCVFRGEGTAYRVQQLEANTGYQFRVRAVNAVGAGSYSQVATAQTSRAPPSPPEDVQAQAAAAASAGSAGARSSSQLTVSWAPAAAQGEQAAAACISYEIEAAAGPSSQRHTCPARCREVVLTGLQPGASYTVRVRGVGADGAGHGVWSAAAKVTMPQQPAEEAMPAHAAAVPAAAAAPKAQKRRERGSSTQQKKTAAAKGPPPKFSVDRWLRRNTGRGLLGIGAIGVLLLLLGYVVMRVCLW